MFHPSLEITFMPRFVPILLLGVIGAISQAGCSENEPAPLSITPPAAGEAPRPIKRGAAKLDGTEAQKASQATR